MWPCPRMADSPLPSSPVRAGSAWCGGHREDSQSPDRKVRPGLGSDGSMAARPGTPVCARAKCAPLGTYPPLARGAIDPNQSKPWHDLNELPPRCGITCKQRHLRCVPVKSRPRNQIPLSADRRPWILRRLLGVAAMLAVAALGVSPLSPAAPPNDVTLMPTHPASGSGGCGAPACGITPVCHPVGAHVSASTSASARSAVEPPTSPFSYVLQDSQPRLRIAATTNGTSQREKFLPIHLVTLRLRI